MQSLFQIIPIGIVAYLGLNYLHKSLYPADQIVALAGGLTAVLIWMLRYDRATLHKVYKNPAGRAVIDQVCGIVGEQPPIDAGAAGAQVAPGAASPPAPGGAQQGPLRIRRLEEFQAVASELRESVLGHDAVISGATEELARNVALLENSDNGASTRPLGLFLFVGKAGLGKRRLAVELGRRLFTSGVTISLDAKAEGAEEQLVTAVKSHPWASVIVDNAQSIPGPFQNALAQIAQGQPLVDRASGTRVSFSGSAIFLLAHADAARLPDPPARNPDEETAVPGTGSTLVVNALTEALGLNRMLSWGIQGIHKFLLPPRDVQAKVIHMIMQEECNKFRVQMGRVDPGVLVREVEESEKTGGFELSPPRVRKLLEPRIAKAASTGQPSVDL